MQGFKAGIETELFGRLDGRFAGTKAVALGNKLRQRRIVGRQFPRNGMVGGDGAERRAENGVLTGGVNFKPVVAVLQIEEHARAFGPADPVFLHQADPIGPTLQILQGVQKVVGVTGNAQEPLAQLPFFNLGARAPALAVDHLLVGQHGLFHRVPVDPRFLTIRQASLQKIEKHLLFVAVIAGLAGGQFARPVIGKAHAFELLAHGLDVALGPLGGRHVILDGGVFRRQTKGVPPHGVQHVEPARLFVAGHQIAQRVIAHMTHVNAPGRIREHFQHIVFRAGRIFGNLEATTLIPRFLPLRFGFFEIIASHRLFFACRKIYKGVVWADYCSRVSCRN